MSYVWCYVIRTKEKNDSKRRLFGSKYDYFARRTSLKNPRFSTNFHLNIKFFSSKKKQKNIIFRNLENVQAKSLVNI